jgi:LEA14-like dessication related protein
MPSPALARITCIVSVTLLLAACAHLAQVVEQPEVRLAGLRLVSADLATQRYAVELAVFNPNRFAVPVRDVAYTLELDGRSFASGTTDAGTRLPAREEVPLEIAVETDLVSSARHVLDWLGRGESSVGYRLRGEIRLDMPGVRNFRFDEAGVVELQR